MAILSVRFFGDPVLREKSKKVDAIDTNIKRLTIDMAETMYDAIGVGLAAPQIGILKQIIVIDVGRDDFVVYVNPEIIERSKSTETEDEGCLCLPEIQIPVTRHKRIVATARDLKGRPLEIEAGELLARILQHEIDHLGGYTILDRCDKDVRQKALQSFMDSQEREA